MDDGFCLTYRRSTFCFLDVLAHNHDMKQPEYKEGPEARVNFERGMKALFKVPKADIVQPKKRPKKTASVRKPKNSDKD
jgi:hypothetical protein